MNFRICIHNNVLACLEDNKDPFCHLLTWKFELITTYNQRKHAETLHACAKKLEGFYSADNETLKAIIFLLLQLRKPPEGDDSIMVKNHFFYVFFISTQLFLG